MNRRKRKIVKKKLEHIKELDKQTHILLESIVHLRRKRIKDKVFIKNLSKLKIFVKKSFGKYKYRERSLKRKFSIVRNRRFQRELHTVAHFVYRYITLFHRKSFDSFEKSFPHYKKELIAIEHSIGFILPKTNLYKKQIETLLKEKDYK